MRLAYPAVRHDFGELRGRTDRPVGSIAERDSQGRWPALGERCGM